MICMIKWNECFSVKVETLDEQHKTFFSLINKLEDITNHSDYLDDLPLVLNEIVEYTNLHFKTEEELLSKLDYPKLKDHQDKHRAIKKDIYIKCKQVIEKEPTALDLIWLHNYMSDWLKNHILEEDAQYADYISQNK